MRRPQAVGRVTDENSHAFSVYIRYNQNRFTNQSGRGVYRMSKLQDMKIHTGKTMLFFCILQLFALSSCSDDEELGNLPEEPTQTGSSYGELEDNDFVATGDVKDISYTAGTALC